jgi:hypothetical protein
MNVIMALKNDVSYLKTDDYQKQMCNKNQNVTEMGMIIQRVYYNLEYINMKYNSCIQ